MNEPLTKVCTNCGTPRASDYDKLCRKCWTKWPDRASKPRSFKAASAIAIVVVVVIILAIVGSFLPSKSSNTSATPKQKYDLPAGDACNKFAKWRPDADAGILSQPELRSKIKDMDGDAQDATTTSIRAASRALLAAVTTGTESDFLVAELQMINACVALP